MKILFTVMLVFISTVCWSSNLTVEKVTVGESYIYCVYTTPKISSRVSDKAPLTCNWDGYNNRVADAEWKKAKGRK